MHISFEDMNQIHIAMGKSCPYLAVEGDNLKLQWWDNDHQVDLVVTDFSGHRDYFTTFIKKVLLITKDFESKISCPREPTKYFLNLCNTYLGENHEI